MVRFGFRPRQGLWSALVMLSCTAGAALADLPRISSESQFREIVSGQTLVRPLVKLQVTPNGQITGTGATWKVSGNWQWQDGYFCRSLNWGGDDLGYNCQEVRSNGERIRFQSDRGTGDFADFRLR